VSGGASSPVRPGEARKRPRRAAFAGAVVALLALGSSAGGCSPAADCKPPIPEGTRYKVTLISELTDSAATGCHVIDVQWIPTFEVKAARTEPTAEHPTCSVTPADGPPAGQQSVKIEQCIPDYADMLGITCDIEYENECHGKMSFYYEGLPNQTVDWSAPVILNALLVITDNSPTCFGGESNCTNKYTVRLDRLDP
jgi:hypothetical protein